MRDVANRAGVSVRTVSNVVNDFPQVSPATRATVQAVIDELGYRPNLVARRLRTGRTGVIGLLIPRLAEHYFAELADAVVTAARHRGRSLVIDQTDGRRAGELSPLDLATRDQLWDGAIVSPLSVTGDDLERHASTPLVVLGEHGASFDLAWVGTDNIDAARDATNYLISLGHRRIAVIGDQRGPGGETGAMRTKGYRAAMRAAGLRVRRDWVVAPSGYDRAEGAAAARRLMAASSPPDAVFCYNDELAFGVLYALHALGLRVPDDVAVLGWDDLRDAQYAVPALSSVSVSRDAVATAAVELLLAQLESGASSREHLVIPHEIAARASTAGAQSDKHPLAKGS
nr:LacI family DNA-binding transcriptional regulator [Flexivirga meconopsidis]